MTMIELSNERVEKILKEETMKTVELPTILRAIYGRYMHLYEDYFSDPDALTDEKIAEMKKYHEETISLLKYYYMDIPLDICVYIHEFDKEYTNHLLGTDWKKYLSDGFKEFKGKAEKWGKDEKLLKAEYKAKVLEAFYGEMGYVFRDGFNTSSKTHESVMGVFKGLLFGK
jgi:hypothetical protein